MSTPMLRLAAMGSLLALPSAAMACGGCVDADMYAMAPWFHATASVLVLWAVSNWILGLVVGIADRPIKGGGNSLLANVIMGGILIVALIGGGFAGVLIILSPFIGYRLIREIFAPRSRIPEVSRLLAMGAFLLMLTMASVGIAWRSGLGELEAFMRLSSPSTAIGRSTVDKFASRADLTPLDFRYYLLTGDPQQQYKALLILERRKNVDDLIALQDVVIPILPEEEPESYRSWGEPAYHVEQWVRVLGMKDIRTRTALEIWLDQQAADADTSQSDTEESPLVDTQRDGP